MRDRRRNAHRTCARVTRHGLWELRIDLKHGGDIYDSFRAYQNKLLREYGSMADEFHFRNVDARRSVVQIQDELRRQVSAFLEPTATS